ncbi:MAG: hypothetical protein ABI604_14720 [Nitrospirota bacterium]
MRRVTVAAFAALCVIGASSLALAAEGKKYGDQIEPGAKSAEGARYGDQIEPGTKAAEGAKYGNQMETGKLSQEPSVLGNKREPVRPNDAMKGKEKEHKEKMTTH